MLKTWWDQIPAQQVPLGDQIFQNSRTGCSRRAIIHRFLALPRGVCKKVIAAPRICARGSYAFLAIASHKFAPSVKFLSCVANVCVISNGPSAQMRHIYVLATIGQLLALLPNLPAFAARFGPFFGICWLGSGRGSGKLRQRQNGGSSCGQRNRGSGNSGSGSNRGSCNRGNLQLGFATGATAAAARASNFVNFPGHSNGLLQRGVSAPCGGQQRQPHLQYGIYYSRLVVFVLHGCYASRYGTSLGSLQKATSNFAYPGYAVAWLYSKRRVNVKI